MADIPDTVTVYVTIHTPATTLFQVPALHDGYSGDLISVEVEFRREDGELLAKATGQQFVTPYSS